MLAGFSPAVRALHRIPRPIVTSCRYTHRGQIDPRKARTKARREALLRVAAAANGGHGETAMLLGRFMQAQVPELSEHELSEVESILALAEEQLAELRRWPGADESRPSVVRGNSMLDRFLNYARFSDSEREFR